MNDRKVISNNEFPVKTVSEIYNTYDFVPSFTIATDTTDYNLKSQKAASFLNVPKAWFIMIWSDQTVSIKFNDTSKPAITIDAGESPYEFKNMLLVDNIFITNVSGNTANIKVMLV